MIDRSSSVAAIKRHRTGQLASLGTKSYYLYRRGQQDKMYTLICDEFIKLGGIYVKFLQGVLLQSPTMRKWRNPDRLRVFENLDQEPLDIVSVLQAELSADKLAQISLVQPQAFAAGSFGQVYYGQHVNGKPVVVKVLRPMVRELLKYDLRLLNMFSRSLASRMSGNIGLDLDTAIKDFRAATLRETDYISEAHFARQLFETYQSDPSFVIPETFLDLCTPNLIVQEYIDGISVAQIIRLQEQGVDPKKYVKETIGSNLDKQLEKLGVELLYGIFELPHIQGDPHPGNIKLLTGDRIGMIDFGISAPTPDNKAAFYGIVAGWNQLYSDDFDISALFEQFMRFFVNDLYRALQRLAIFKTKSDSKDHNYTREVGRMAQEVFKKTVGVTDIRPLIEDGRVLQIMNQIINKDNRFGLVLKLEDSEILRAVQTYITLVDTLGRRNAVLPNVFAGVVERVGRLHPEIISQQDATMSVSEAIDVVSQWLERIATRDPAFFSELMNRIKISSAAVVKPKAVPFRKKATHHEQVDTTLKEKEKINA